LPFLYAVTGLALSYLTPRLKQQEQKRLFFAHEPTANNTRIRAQTEIPEASRLGSAYSHRTRAAAPACQVRPQARPWRIPRPPGLARPPRNRAAGGPTPAASGQTPPPHPAPPHLTSRPPPLTHPSTPLTSHPPALPPPFPPSRRAAVRLRVRVFLPVPTRNRLGEKAQSELPAEGRPPTPIPRRRASRPMGRSPAPATYQLIERRKGTLFFYLSSSAVPFAACSPPDLANSA
jgi:hypothetical protein